MIRSAIFCAVSFHSKSIYFYSFLPENIHISKLVIWPPLFFWKQNNPSFHSMYPNVFNMSECKPVPNFLVYSVFFLFFFQCQLKFFLSLSLQEINREKSSWLKREREIRKKIYHKINKKLQEISPSCNSYLYKLQIHSEPSVLTHWIQSWVCFFFCRGGVAAANQVPATIKYFLVLFFFF